jgi:hypothetical protein
MIFNVLDEPIERVQVFLDTKKNGALHSNLACLERLIVIVTTQLQLNLQLKNN